MIEQLKNLSPNILVAEDDPDDRLLVKQALRETGFSGNLRFVNDGIELMEYLHCSKCPESAMANPRPDFLLLDLYMPGKNGLEALQEIKSDPDLSSIKIVALTGSGMRDDAEICRKLGAECLLTKPSSYTSWLEMMDSVLGLMPDSSRKKW
jgi:two-component system response regulator